MFSTLSHIMSRRVRLELIYFAERLLPCAKIGGPVRQICCLVLHRVVEVCDRIGEQISIQKWHLFITQEWMDWWKGGRIKNVWEDPLPLVMKKYVLSSTKMRRTPHMVCMWPDWEPSCGDPPACLDVCINVGCQLLYSHDVYTYLTGDEKLILCIWMRIEQLNERNYNW